jgi:catechol O-methyltransferase
MASQLPEDTLIVTIELNPASAATARRIHEHAGVANRIHIVVDRTDHAIPRLREQFKVDAFDFIFIDHHKEAYLSDFQLLEQAGLIQRGTVIVADNILYPGAPDYVNYVRNNPHYTSTFHESTLEYDPTVRDGVEISTRQWQWYSLVPLK